MSESVCEFKSSIFRETIKFKKLKVGKNIYDRPENIFCKLPESVAVEDHNGTKGFTSFRIALQFPECLDDVDVISEADNIKMLFKLPEMPKAGLSMLVHKVGNSILLDKFDTNKIRSKEDWKILSSFLSLKNDDSDLTNSEFINLTKKTDISDCDKGLLSQFLTHSIQSIKINGCAFNKMVYNATKPLETFGTVLPEPSFKVAIPLSRYGRSFNRNVVWSFAGFKFLIGTNAHIFEGLDRPRVSLRLNDISEPFMAVTGKDFWLDNLILSIPEVLICHHLNGIVQKYESIRTVDLPKQEKSEFSQKLVQNVAQNIIQNLKNFVSQRGHTYFLYKDKDDDDLILFDMTVLSELGEKYGTFRETPFTVAIAMLHYSLTTKIISSNHQLSDEKAAFLFEMLTCSLKLIPLKKHSEIIASIFFCRSALYVPNVFDFNVLESHDENLQSSTNKKSDKQTELLEYILIENIFEDFNTDQIENISKKRQRLFVSLQDRCNKALSQIISGIKCIELSIGYEEISVKQSEICAKQEIIIKCPGAADEITMNDTSLPPTTNTLELILISFMRKQFNSWKFHIKLLFVQKACVVYTMLYRCNNLPNSLGLALKYVYMALRCQKMIQKYSTEALENIFLFFSAADTFQSITCRFENIDTYLQQYSSYSEFDTIILKELHLNLGFEMNKVLDEPIRDFIGLLDKCLDMYSNILTLAAPPGKRRSLLIRTGNDFNSLSQKILVIAQEYYDKNMNTFLNISEKREIDDNFVNILRRSFEGISRALPLYQELNDKHNIAMFMLNKAFLLRTRTKINLRGETEEDFNMVLTIYNDIDNCYEEGKKALMFRENSAELWDLLHWDNCSTNLIIAEFVQDKCPNINTNTAKLHNEAFKMLNRALTLCFTGFNFQEQYFYRQGLIHARLCAYKFDQMTLNLNDPASIEALRMDCEQHAKSAHDIFESLKKESDYLKLQLDRIDYLDFFINTTKDDNTKATYLISALYVCLETVALFKYIVDNEKRDDPDNMLKQMKRFEERLHYVLKNLIKLSINNPQTMGHLINIYKQMYFFTLHTFQLADKFSFAQHLNKVLAKVIDIKINELDKRYNEQ